LQNQERAGSAYTVVQPDEVADKGELSGLPWGGLSMSHVLQAGKTKDLSTAQQQNSTPSTTAEPMQDQQYPSTSQVENLYGSGR